MKPISLADQKNDLRNWCYNQRIRIADHEAESAAQAVAAKVISIVDVSTRTIVSAYWPLPGELDPRPGFVALGERGATLALPRTVGDAQPLEFHSWQPQDNLIEGRFKVMEPPSTAARVQPDILLIPLLAFDRYCHRLGHGKGYYDRTLQGLRSQNPAVLAIGVAFAVQEIEHVPTDANDQTLDIIITEQDVYRPA